MPHALRPARLALALAALALVLAAAAAAPAHAARSMDIGIADDRVLLDGSDAAATAAVEAWSGLGVDVVRIHALWGRIAPRLRQTRMPAGFDPRDPESPQYNWSRLDRAIGLVRAHGMRVLLTVTGYGPWWGSSVPLHRDIRYKPDPGRFAAFATAVARRYGDRVDDYIVWNEPNQRTWLRPQWTCRRGRCTPASPHLYRRILLQAIPAIRAADPGARIIVGSLAPRGSTPHRADDQMRPMPFLRALGCVDARYRRYRGGSCRGFSAPVADGFAIHAHGLKASPTTPSPNPDNVQIADLPRLEHALDAVTRARGLRKRGGGRFGLWIDEYGYQTNPPDRYLGVRPAIQAAWLQLGAYKAWHDPRVRNLTQYVWRDEPLSRLNTWQSGLRYASGRAKPALAGFRAPFWPVRRSLSTVALWGQVRPGGATTVRLERRVGRTWRQVGSARTDARGAFQRTIRARGAV
ncbi:MAG TPA: cellulase family glycosylhydrolase, partial [Solirubrobacteraceae bacterium]|nr:cellulase family glycosylhydrolase [Solirubrobacteraceae bacterium]